MKTSLVHASVFCLLLVLTTHQGISTAAPSAVPLRNFIGVDHLGNATEIADPAVKAKINKQIDNAAEALAGRATSGASKVELLAELGNQIKTIDRDDLSTHDAESVTTAFEAMLEPLGLESSDGFLNTWMYGFDPR